MSRGAQDSRSRRQGGPPRTPVISGPIEPFVVQPGELSGGPRRLGPGQQSLGPVRVQPDLLPLGVVKRTRLLPDRRRDPDTTEVGSQRGHLQGREVAGWYPASLRCRDGELRHRTGLPREEARLQVGEVAHHPARLDQRGRVEVPMRLGFGGENVRPQRRTIDHRQDRFWVLAEHGRETWFERRPRTVFHHGDGGLDTAEPVVHLDLVDEGHDAHDDREILAADAVWHTRAVPPLEGETDPLHDRVGKVQARGQHSGHLAVAQDVGLASFRGVRH